MVGYAELGGREVQGGKAIDRLPREEEIAFDARPAVYAGKFERITNAVGA
jgi:hypothetical protein